MIDALGRTIQRGDTVAYPNRRGSRTELCHGTVHSIFDPVDIFGGPASWMRSYLKLQKPNGRRVKVTHLDRVVICRRAEIPTA